MGSGLVKAEHTLDTLPMATTLGTSRSISVQVGLPKVSFFIMQELTMVETLSLGLAARTGLLLVTHQSFHPQEVMTIMRL